MEVKNEPTKEEKTLSEALEIIAYFVDLVEIQKEEGVRLYPNDRRNIKQAQRFIKQNKRYKIESDE